MPKFLTLENHLSKKQLQRKYISCQHPQEKLRWHALSCITGGEVVNTVAKDVGRSGGWITKVVNRYNQGGVEAIKNKSKNQDSKTLTDQQIKRIKEANPFSKVRLWAHDEGRFGLQPNVSRRWAKVGHRPIVEVNPQYEWTWSYGAAEPTTGMSFFLLLPDLQAGCVSDIFKRICQNAESVEGKYNRDDAGRRTGASRTVGSTGRNRVGVASGIHTRDESE